MDSLISTQSLADMLGADNLVVLDATKHLPAAGRDGRSEFADAHIPSARFFDLAQLVDENSAVPQAHPRPQQLAAVLGDCGVTPSSNIVLYDDSAVKTSARAWFLLRAHGFENAAIIDGGLGKWRAEGRDLESGAPVTNAAEPIALSQPNRFRYKADMLANIDSAAAQVLDARDAERFSGSVEDNVHDMQSGHIPNSCNLHFAKLFAADGTYRPCEELRAMFENAGITADRPIITSCGSGVTASVLLFALHLTGREDTALYDGSWLEWGSDPDTPKAVTG